MLWWLSSGWGLSQGAEAIIAAASGGAGLTNIEYQVREHNYVVVQTTWFGTFEHNVFSGDIVNVTTSRIETKSVILAEYKVREERIIFTPTGQTIGTKSNSYYNHFNHKPINNPIPRVGLNIY